MIALFALLVVRRRVERALEAALRIDAVRGVASELEREDARDVRRERQRLQVEHQLDVLGERVGHADRRAGQLARLAAAVGRPRPSGCGARSRARRPGSRVSRARSAAPRFFLQPRHRRCRASRGCCVLGAALLALGRRRADAEQLIEHHARVAHHRQRLVRRRPADRVGVGAGVAVGAAARLIDVLDAQLHRRNRRVLAVAAARRYWSSDVPTCTSRALRLLRVHLRQEHRARAEVIAADLRRRERFGVAHVGVADDGE